MIETILLALLAAKIKGYKLKPLFKSWEIYIVFAFLVIYVFLNMGVFFGYYGFIKYARPLESLYICSFLILIVKYRQYVSAITGSAAIIAGSVLNRVAIGANSGKMPVFPTLSYLTGYVKPGMFAKVNDIHVLGNAATKLKFLTDTIDLGYSILSIGDVLIRIFTFIIIFNTIRSINKMNALAANDTWKF